MVWEKEDALGGWPKCTASSHDSIDEGRKSFPSGERHAAVDREIEILAFGRASKVIGV